MLISVDILIDALNGENDARLNLLRDCRAVLSSNEEFSVYCTSYFAEVRVEWQGEIYLLMLPLSQDSTMNLLSRVTYLKKSPLSRLANYRVLSDELSYRDNRGDICTADLILYHLPAGETLSQLVERGEVDWERLIEASYHTEELFSQAGVAHNNLKASNLIITPSYDILPIRYVDATLDAPREQIHSEFTELRSFLSRSGGVAVTPLKEQVRSQYQAVKYDSIDGEFNGMRLFIRDGLYGYLNHRGEEAIAAQYHWAGNFHEGRAEVQLGDEMGLVNLLGEYVIPLGNEIVEYVVELGYARVKRSGEWAVFDHNGRQIAPFESRYITDEILGEL